MKRGDLVRFRPISTGDPLKRELVITRFISIADDVPGFPKDPVMRILRDEKALAIVQEVSGKYVRVISASGETGWVHKSDVQFPEPTK